MAQFEEYYLQEGRGCWQLPESHLDTMQASPFSVVR
jgi:hypothetical protein